MQKFFVTAFKSSPSLMLITALCEVEIWTSILKMTGPLAVGRAECWDGVGAYLSLLRFLSLVRKLGGCIFFSLFVLYFEPRAFCSSSFKSFYFSSCCFLSRVTILAYPFGMVLGTLFSITCSK